MCVCVCVYTHTHTQVFQRAIYIYIQVFQRAIDEDYYFEFIYDDLPLWGFIGDSITLSTHYQHISNILATH